jgi:hypothetical protein
MTSRSRQLHAAVAQASARNGATYVNLFRERAQDPFVQQPQLNAADGLHPSDAGYRQWWSELETQAGWHRAWPSPVADQKIRFHTPTATWPQTPMLKPSRPNSLE